MGPMIKTVAVHPKENLLLQLIFASLFIGICAQIKIPLWFTPVPITGQTFGVILVGTLLGSKKGALAAIFYLIEGILGLPVWAGGAAGFLHLMGPTGGYRFAYVLQAYLVGCATERYSLSFPAKATLLFLICCLQMLLGSVWLAFFVGLPQALAKGFYPFVLIEAIKVVILTRIRK